MKTNLFSHWVPVKLVSFISLPRSYVSFLSGYFISRLGDALYMIAIPWISYELTKSAIVMSTLFVTSVLPIILFGPFAGVVVDRFDKRKLMLAADAARAVLVAFIPIFHLLHVLEVWQLYAVSFILSVLTMLFDVCTVVITPSIAGDHLTKANSFYQISGQVSDMIGPVIAGIVISLFGGFNALWIDVLSFSGTMLVLVRLKPVRPDDRSTVLPSKAEGLLQNMTEGFKWLKRDRLNLALSLQAMIGNFGYSTAFAILIFYLRTKYGLESEQIGSNFALLGLGGFLGALIIVPLERRFGRAILIPLLLYFGTAGFFVALLPFWLSPGIGFGMVSVCNVAWNVLVTSLRQETIPPQMMGRVLSFSRVLTRSAMPVGAMFGGLFAKYLDPSVVFWIAGVSKAAEVVIAKKWIVPNMRKKPEG